MNTVRQLVRNLISNSNRLLILLPFVVVSGCGKSDPITLTETHSQYIGVWQTLYEQRTDSSWDVNNMLLVIYPDSTAAFRQCFISQTFNERSKRSRSKSVSMPDAYITEIADGEITLEQEQEVPIFGSVSFDYDLVVSIEPYDENGRTYMEVEETLLTRLNNDEINSQTAWECPELEDDDDF